VPYKLVSNISQKVCYSLRGMMSSTHSTKNLLHLPEKNKNTQLNVHND
jgi:hypothetical protein